MWLCLKHFNELCDSALTEQDVSFTEKLCELCQEAKPCVLAYDSQMLPYHPQYTLDNPTA